MVKGELDTSKIQANLKRALEKAYQVQVGFQGSAKSGNRTISLKQIAIWNFYGTRNIVARNPLERINFKGLEKVKGLGSFLVGGRGAKSPSSLEKFIKSRIQKAFYARFPANRPSTIRRKGFNQPLIWTGKLKNSVIVSIKGKRR